MFGKVKEYIEKHHMIQKNDTIIVGISGGADSVCLLVVLWMLKEEKNLTLQAVHINHGIRKEAVQDENYVKELCKKYGVPLTVVHEDVRSFAKREHISEEEAGRNVRYLAFQAECAKYTALSKQVKIAVAHNKNDLAETVLFHLFRGSGLRGISGILPIRENIIRPILCAERYEIEAFLEEKEICFCVDQSNLQNLYTRNKIRNQLLPYINKEICENAVEHIAETAAIAQEAECFLQKEAIQRMAECVKEEGGMRIDIAAVQKQEGLLQNYIVKECMIRLSENRKDITKKHVKEVISLFTKPVGKTIMLPYGIIAKKLYCHILLTKENKLEEEIDTDVEIEIFPPQTVVLPDDSHIEFVLLAEKNSHIIHDTPYTKYFDYDKIKKSLKLRCRQMGDYLTINEKMEKKSLKSYMINEKIPKEDRDKKLLLADENHILWVIGYRISQYYKVSETTETILQVKYTEGT